MDLSPLYKQIAEKGAIPFVDYMQQVLYAPHFGYYSAGLQKFGIEGDFITAPELTPLFGKTVANQCQQVLSQFDEPVLFEFGAGSGRLCVDVLQRLEELNCLPTHYFILEISPSLKHRQQEFIQQTLPHFIERIRWLDRWPEEPFNGVILANEVLDAMPVHRFIQTEQGLLESFVGLDTKNKLIEIYKPEVNPRLAAYLEAVLAKSLFPYQSEANLFLDSWIAECYTMLKSGAVFLIDYGFPRHEYYHPDRKRGTLSCHYRHHVHSDPLLYPGEQDITAHVDFTHVAEAADKAGFIIRGYCNQASFLLANGLLSFLNEIDDERLLFKAQQAVKKLLQPHEMGELFKVIALTKDLDLPLTGFLLHDKRASL